MRAVVPIKPARLETVKARGMAKAIQAACLRGNTSVSYAWSKHNSLKKAQALHSPRASRYKSQVFKKYCFCVTSQKWDKNYPPIFLTHLQRFHPEHYSDHLAMPLQPLRTI